MSSAIKVENISKRYGKNTVLNDVNLDIKKGEFVCLLGPSGCGKSTLLRLIAGLDTPTEGKVYLNGKDATYLPPAQRNFGIMFQSYALFPNLTAAENVGYGLTNRKMKSAEKYEIIDRLLETVGLTSAKGRYPSQLSGGEQQRVALARALAINPNFLLLDEPLSALDAKVRIKLRREICRIQRELGLTTIMVTHDQDEALTMADRIIVMNKAEIMQSGTPIEIYEKPANKFVADFIGAINFYESFTKEEGTKAIRPEYVEIVDANEADSHLCDVLDIEFRGNYSRITAKISHVLRNDEFIIDMPFKQIQRLEIKSGDKIHIKFDEQQVLDFAG